jgi:hypothetical protein
LHTKIFLTNLSPDVWFAGCKGTDAPFVLVAVMLVIIKKQERFKVQVSKFQGGVKSNAG